MMPIPSTMKAPRDRRPGIWRDGVMQIKLTNACTLDCRNCTSAVGLAKKHKRVWFMPLEKLEQALASIEGYFGVVGYFGGDPTLHPDFPAACDLLVKYFPDIDQRGLWSNDLMGHGAVCRRTFSPIHSNLNVHRDSAAAAEIRRDWPEARILQDGIDRPSMHGSWWNAMSDLVPDEAERWEKIGKCFVNQTWSSEITMIRGELRAFFCEWAATRAEYADVLGEPDTGLPVMPGWWREPLAHFETQIRHHCHRCGAPLNPRKIEDLGDEPEDFTISNAPVFLTIKGRPSRQVFTREEVETTAPATKYLPTGVMRSGL